MSQLRLVTIALLTSIEDWTLTIWEEAGALQESLERRGKGVDDVELLGHMSRTVSGPEQIVGQGDAVTARDFQDLVLAVGEEGRPLNAGRILGPVEDDLTTCVSNSELAAWTTLVLLTYICERDEERGIPSCCCGRHTTSEPI